MLPNTYSCQKCPDAENREILIAKQNQTSTCPLERESAQKPSQEPSQTKGLRLSTLTETSLPGLNIAKELPGAKTSPFLAEQQSKNLFDSNQLDDRSIQSRFKVSLVARTTLALLIFFHGLGQTPGIGSTGQSFSDFEISNSVISRHKSGLALTYSPFDSVDSRDRPVYSIY
jgi:hypothetical protein